MQFERVESRQARHCDGQNLELGTPYGELHRMAEFQLRYEPLRYLWSPAELISESYIRLVEHYGTEWAQRGSGRSLWIRVMRHVLIDGARSFRAAKRNRGQFDDLSTCQVADSPRSLDLAISLGAEVASVCAADPRRMMVLQLRFRDGLTFDETANRLKVSPRTVKRVWREVRTELLKRLSVSASPTNHDSEPTHVAVTRLVDRSAFKGRP